MKPYEILEHLCKEVRNESNSVVGSKELSKRASHICEVLDCYEINYHVDKFKDEKGSERRGEDLYFFNIEVSFTAEKPTEDTVMFIAHHDVLDVKSENCQDNTASVVNLLDVCFRLKKMEEDFEYHLKNNVIIVFTDCEECGLCGAAKLSKDIVDNKWGNVLFVVNSELTALGGNLWMEQSIFMNDFAKDKLEGVEILEKNTPLNDSYRLRDFGIPSMCFGILPDGCINNSRPDTWMLCHSEADTFEGSNEDDMSKYVDFLMRFI